MGLSFVALAATRPGYSMRITWSKPEVDHVADKVDTARRLAQIASLLAGNPNMTQSEIARQLRVDRSTVLRSLPMLEERGIMLVEDDQGHLSVYQR
jgi:uncharacterized membrane protein